MDSNRESPFACDMSVLSRTQRDRQLALLRTLRKGNEEARELEDGFEFRFRPDIETIRDIAEFISCERLCCPFFDLELAIEREGGPVWLRVRGRTGVKEFIRLEFGL